jgi:hypothetical protein
MRKKTKKQKGRRPKTRLGFPDLDQSKAAVIGSLRSPESQRGYRHAIDEFIEWYCSEPPQAHSQGPSHQRPERKTVEPGFRAAVGGYLQVIRSVC